MKYIPKWFMLALLLSGLAILLGHEAAFAQRVGIFGKENYSYVSTPNGNFRLDVYFNLVDGVGQVLTAADLESVKIQLQNGREATFQPTQPSSPFYITLVLDISGSMAGRPNIAMREAALASLQNAPDNAQFSIITFHQEIALYQDFTGQTALLQTQLSALEAVNGGGTCLYDAMRNALNTSKSIPSGRRAIIVFTDGVDEVRGGGPCSVTPIGNVIAEAQSAKIPLYTIGLDGQGAGGAQVNKTELARVANETGGLFYSGNQSALAALFGAIMETLSSQWYIQAAPLYPDEGDQIARILPVLAGGEELSEPFEVRFNSPRDFDPPVDCIVSVNPPQFDRANETYSFLVSVPDPSIITSLTLQIVTQNTGVEHSSRAAQVGQPVQVPLSEFEYATAYQVIALVTSTNSSCPNGSTVFGTPQPPATPDPLSCNVNLGNIRQEGSNLVLPFTIVDANSGVSSLTYAVVDGRGIEVPNIGGTIPDPRSVNQITIPADPLIPESEYTLRVRLNGVDGTNCPDITQKFMNPILLPFLQVASMNPMSCEKPVVMNLEWTNKATSASISNLQFTLNNSNGTKIREQNFSEFPSQISWDYGDLKSKQSYNIMASIEYDTDPNSPNTTGITPTFSFHSFSYEPSSTPVCIFKSVVSSPFLLIPALILLLAGGYFFYAQQRSEKERQAETESVGYLYADGTMMDARAGLGGFRPKSNQGKPDFSSNDLPSRPRTPAPSRNPAPAPPYGSYETGPLKSPFDNGMETLNGLKPVETEVVPQNNPIFSSASKEDAPTVNGVPQVIVTVVKCKTKMEDIRSANRPFDPINRTVMLRTLFTIGRENCSLTLDRDANISRTHLHAEFSARDGNAYKIIVKGQNKTFFDDREVAQNQSFLLMPDQKVRVEIPDKDGTKVVLELRYVEAKLTQS